MLNTECLKNDNHRWGVCRQVCADCGAQDLITVNLCEDMNAYFCYSCTNLKVGA